jgi:hypothetical protein
VTILCVMNRYLGPGVEGAARSRTAAHIPADGVETSAAGYAAIVALLAAAIVWSPATGDVAATVIVAGLASTALSLVEQSRARARRGPRRLTGQRHVLLLVGLGALVMAGVGGSFAAVVAGQGALGLAIAFAAFVTVFAGTWLSERGARAATA